MSVAGWRTNTALRASKEVARRIGLLAQNATTPERITVQERQSPGRYPHQQIVTAAWEDACRRQCHTCNRYHLTGGAKCRHCPAVTRQRAWIAMVLARESVPHAAG